MNLERRRPPAPRRARHLARVLFAVLLGGLVALAAQSCAEDPLSSGSPDAGASTDGPGNDPDGSGLADRGDDPAPHDAGSVPADGSGVDGAVYLEAGSPCEEDAGLGCAPGLLCCAPCCRAGAAPICARASMGRCPLPDLQVNQTALGTGMIVETIEAGSCEMEERCLADAGARRVLRFDVRIGNRGTADLVLGRPDGSPGFEYASCHGHYHFTDFARYALLDDAGAAIVVGRKQAFCARDNVRVDPTASAFAHYDCERQGIQRGWEDIYAPTLPCQYLDITDVPPGHYMLEVEVNPDGALTELDYSNNRAAVPVVLP